MNLSTAFIDTIKHDKSKIFRAFVREDIKMLVGSVRESGVLLANRLRGAGSGVSANAAKKLSKMKEDGVEKHLARLKAK